MPNEAPKKPTVRRNRKEGQAPIYADHTNVAAGSFGFKITFGNVVDANEEEVTVDDIVTVGMSAEHAYALLVLLGQHLDGYGKNVGPIRVPMAAEEDPRPEGEGKP